MVKFKEFLVGDLFTEFIVGNQPVHSNRFDNKEAGMFPVITGVTLNNGVGFYSYRENAKLYKNILTVSKDGEYAGTLFLQKQDVILGGHSLGLYNEEVSSESLLYIMGCLNKYQREGFWKQGGVMGSVTLKLIKELPISLPVTPDGIPDYAYMEGYIKGIQRQYIDNLIETNETERNRLLSIVGLSLDEYESVKGNIELSDAENYGEFKVGDLFDSHLGKQVDYSNVGKYKVVSGVTENNGVLGYTDSNNHAVYENCLTVSNRGEYCGTAYIQKEPFVLSNNVIALVPKSEITFSFLLFSATCINKLNYGGYSGYPTKAGILNDVIKLPTTLTGEVDYAYMEDYISKIKLIYIYTIGNYLLTLK